MYSSRGMVARERSRISFPVSQRKLCVYVYAKTNIVNIKKFSKTTIQVPRPNSIQMYKNSVQRGDTHINIRTLGNIHA